MTSQTASSATSGARSWGEELSGSKRKPSESSTSRTKPSEERPRRERQPPCESSGTTIPYRKMIQMIDSISFPEERWKRVGSGLHALHMHLQKHVQQQLKKSLSRIQRLWKTCTHEIMNMLGSHYSPQYLKDLTLWLDASVTSTETHWGAIQLEPNSATKLFRITRQLCRKGGKSLGSRTS